MVKAILVIVKTPIQCPGYRSLPNCWRQSGRYAFIWACVRTKPAI